MKSKKNDNSKTTQLKNKTIKKGKKYFNKVNITFFSLLLIDIVLVVYTAKLNIVNYAVVLEKEIFVSKTRYLLLGRNYINVIITAFFYLYFCLLNKFFLKRNNTKKFLIFLLIGLIVINVALFAIFTKKVY